MKGFSMGRGADMATISHRIAVASCALPGISTVARRRHRYGYPEPHRR
jgi:hypothetical protein